MRRTRSLTASLLVLGTIFAPAAARAHPASLTGTIPVGRRVTLSINVPSEQSAPMTAVDVALPATFTYAAATGGGGWQVTRSGAALTFRGPALPVGTSALFSIEGTATQAGVLRFDVVTHDSGGKTFAWDGEPSSENPAVFVNAGSGGAPESGTPAWREPRNLAVAALVLVGLGMLAYAAVSGRRRGVE